MDAQDKADNYAACLECEHAAGEGRDRRCSIVGDRIVSLSINGACPKGKHEPPGVAGTRAKPVTAVPRGEWPRIVRAVARKARPGEAGVGDTLERLFNAPAVRGRGAGAMFKAFTKKVGIDCGCGKRQKWYNARYPYAPGE